MVSTETRQIEIARAGGRCEYCRMHHSLQGATFHVEHVFPRSAGGSDDAENLALACPSCNLHKSDRVAVASLGWSEPIALFNPRSHLWLDHFEWDEYAIAGKTPIGIATIDALHLNDERRQKIRQAERLFDLFPPEA
ncbi:HNH endonuclease [Rubripirellula tenax]|nr:HNH endonuclease [Rubripirellula tenax]